MAGEISTSSIIETKNYGSTWKPSAVIFDVKAGLLRVIYESHDGAGYTGKHFMAECREEGTVYHYSDGTQETQPTPKLSAPGPQAIVDWATLRAFVQSKAR